jgi:AraC-like DNA-binding protein
VRYLLKGGSGAMIVVFEGRILSIPFVEMLDSKGIVKVRKVDIGSELYEVAREYMIRLEEQDLEGNRLKDLARVAKISPENFKERFGYLVKPPSEY